MTHLPIRNIGLLSFFVLWALQPLLAQKTGSAPPGIDTTQNIILTGNVVMADGSPPPLSVPIERVCGQKTALVGYTDAKGFFNFELLELFPAGQDVSESGRDAYNARSVKTFNANSFGIQAPGVGNAPLTGGGCDLRASLAGFRSTTVMIHTLASTSVVNVGTLVLLSTEKQPSSASSSDMNAPKRAKKAYERASAHLLKSKFSDAQKDLEEAVKVYPRYASAWSDLGWLRERQNQLVDAREAFARAREADDKFAPAYLGLASVAVRQSNWPEAREFSARAVQLNAKDFPTAFYYNAVANFQLGNLEKAEHSARSAVQLDVRHVLPQANLLLGSILASKGDYGQAAVQLKLYLEMVPQAPNAESVRQRVSQLERLSTGAGTLPTRDAVPEAAASASGEMSWEALTNWTEIIKSAGAPRMPLLEFQQNWAPPDIDQLVPPVTPGVSCPANDVLAGIGSQAKALVDSLQRFSATERIEHVEVDKHGNQHAPTSAIFTYVADIQKGPLGYLQVEEYRNGGTTQSFPAKMATKGTAAHALIFHPDLVADYIISCEGLASMRGQPAWQLRFAQRPDRPANFRAYQTPRGTFAVQLKGRAWVAADTYQVLRMETDLVKPVPEILLQKDHVIIDYRPVDFPQHQVQLWLPETAEMYGDLFGQRFRRRHSFSNFELFWVDTEQQDKIDR
jgi:tetratricopeptide (TPR) repeat protein